MSWTITFTWEAGEAALDTGTVTVSYHPVTDDAYKDDALCQLAPTERCDRRSKIAPRRCCSRS